MTWIASAITAATTIGGAVIASNGAKSAAKTTQQAADNSTALQGRIFDQTTANNRPFLDTGTAALSQLASLYGVGAGGTGSPSVDPNATFYQTPDYQFALSQGIKGTDAGAAARGMLDSGATRKAEIAYAGNLASGQFQNYANRLQSLAGIGQAAANNQASAGANYANGYTNTVTNAAANVGNSQIANSNTYANALTGIAGQAQNYFNNKSPTASSYGDLVQVTPSPITGNLGNSYGLPPGVLN